MYWDFILGALAIILIYFFVIKEQKTKSLLIASKKLWFDWRPYCRIAIVIACIILCLYGLNLDITSGAKKTCIIIMVLSSMYIIYRLVKILNLDVEALIAIALLVAGLLGVIVAVVFEPEFESCLG